MIRPVKTDDQFANYDREFFKDRTTNYIMIIVEKSKK